MGNTWKGVKLALPVKKLKLVAEVGIYNKLNWSDHAITVAKSYASKPQNHTSPTGVLWFLVSYHGTVLWNSLDHKIRTEKNTRSIEEPPKKE